MVNQLARPRSSQIDQDTARLLSARRRITQHKNVLRPPTVEDGRSVELAKALDSIGIPAAAPTALGGHADYSWCIEQ